MNQEKMSLLSYEDVINSCHGAGTGKLTLDVGILVDKINSKTFYGEPQNDTGLTVPQRLTFVKNLVESAIRNFESQTGMKVVEFSIDRIKSVFSNDEVSIGIKIEQR